MNHHPSLLFSIIKKDVRNIAWIYDCSTAQKEDE